MTKKGIGGIFRMPFNMSSTETHARLLGMPLSKVSGGTICPCRKLTRLSEVLCTCEDHHMPCWRLTPKCPVIKHSPGIWIAPEQDSHKKLMGRSGDQQSRNIFYHGVHLLGAPTIMFLSNNTTLLTRLLHMQQFRQIHQMNWSTKCGSKFVLEESDISKIVRERRRRWIPASQWRRCSSSQKWRSLVGTDKTTFMCMEEFYCR